MKPSFLLFALLGGALPAFLPNAIAQNEPIVVAPVEGRELHFNWPRSGDVFVRDVRSVTLPTGRSRLQLQGLSGVVGDSAAYAPTLKLSPPAKLLKSLPTLKFGAPPPPSSSNTVSFFDSFLGQRVSLLQETRTGERTVTGILRQTDGRYSLETADGILFAPSGQWLLPAALKPATTPPASGGNTAKEPARSDSSNASLANSYDPVWLVNGEGKTQVEANYTVRNLSWAPRYTGFLTPDRKTVQMQGAITLSTPNDFDFRGAIFKLVDPQGIISLSDTSDLHAGTTAIGFWSGTFTITQALSFYNGEWTKNIGTETEYAPVQRTYKTVENGGAFLPRGPLTLWQQNTDGTTQPSNFESFGATQGDVPLILPLSDQTNDSSVWRVVTSNKLLNPQTREVIITWKVKGRTDGPSLSITDTLPYGADIKETSLKPVENDGTTLRFEVRGTTEFSYRFQIPNR